MSKFIPFEDITSTEKDGIIKITGWCYSEVYVEEKVLIDFVESEILNSGKFDIDKSYTAKEYLIDFYREVVEMYYINVHNKN